jgi:hypothetical protein
MLRVPVGLVPGARAITVVVTCWSPSSFSRRVRARGKAHWTLLLGIDAAMLDVVGVPIAWAGEQVPHATWLQTGRSLQTSLSLVGTDVKEIPNCI